jgi:hypothetical protein
LSFRSLGVRQSLGFTFAADYAGQVRRRPIVSVEIAAPAGGGIVPSARLEMLVDSGADRTMLLREFVEPLGVVLPDKPDWTYTTADGRHAPGWNAQLLINVVGPWLLVPVTVREEGLSLLGREGVFEQIRFAFLHHAGVLLAGTA